MKLNNEQKRRKTYRDKINGFYSKNKPYTSSLNYPLLNFVLSFSF